MQMIEGAVQPVERLPKIDGGLLHVQRRRRLKPARYVASLLRSSPTRRYTVHSSMGLAPILR